jgi:hypothetical protein
MANLRQTQSILRPNDFARFGAAFSAINHRQRARDFCRCPASASNFPRRGPPSSGGCSKDFLSLTELPPASVETPLNKLLAFLRA